MQFDEFLKEACPPLDLEWRKYRRRAARHRVNDRIAKLGLTGYEDYLDRLRVDQAEAAGLADRMRMTISRFFRERPCWKDLGDEVLPALLADMPPARPLRVWSAGCCGGEEPYTLALIWLEQFRDRSPDREIEIVATDIDAASLERARKALYGPGSVREVPQAVLHRHFNWTGQGWQLGNHVKDMVDLKSHGLMDDPPPGKIDLVLCRYLVFTYYRGTRRVMAASRLHDALRPGGALMIGRKEELDDEVTQLFTSWPGAGGIFRRPV